LKSKKTFCGRKDVRTDKWTVRMALLWWLKRLKYFKQIASSQPPRHYNIEYISFRH